LNANFVTRPNIESQPSEYYPPRARWYRRFFDPWLKLRRELHLGRIRLPAAFSFSEFVLSLVLPGYVFFLKGRRHLGWAFFGVYCLAAMLFVVALGYPIGSVGFGLMISAHASSIIFLEGCWLREDCRFGLRLVLAGVTLLAVWQACYSPLLGLAERFITPLRVRGNVVIIRQMSLPRDIKCGDWIMYSLESHAVGDAHQEGGAVRVQAGLGLGPVLAVAGDRVEFSENAFTVNGVAKPLRPHMPNSGGFVVPEKHWFVWPEFDISGHGNASEANLSAVMLQMSTVSEVEFIGKSFKHWFWRRQIIL
jgi:hypothetical protein